MCTLLTQNICLMCHTQVLELGNNQIGDAGLTALAKAVESGALDHLKNLYLGKNKCSQQSKDMLKTAMSKTNCSIHF